MRRNLPIEMLRSFVAIAERGSMSLAADDIGLTQSALSLQMKRLAEITEASLFERHFRGLILTPAGKSLLNYAHAILKLNDRALATLAGNPAVEPVRIGMIEDFADGILPDVLIRFSQSNPETRLEIRIANSTELRALQANGILDVAICLADVADASALATPPLLWLGHGATMINNVLPLVLMENPCRFRDIALATLEEYDIPYRIVMETPNLSVLCSAVKAAIGITCRTGFFLPERLPVLHALEAPLPSIGVVVHSAPNPSEQLRQLLKLVRSTICSLDA